MAKQGEYQPTFRELELETELATVKAGAVRTGFMRHELYRIAELARGEARDYEIVEASEFDALADADLDALKAEVLAAFPDATTEQLAKLDEAFGKCEDRLDNLNGWQVDEHYIDARVYIAYEGRLVSDALGEFCRDRGVS